MGVFIIIITIDGPAGAGKSTVAKKLASILNYTYLDTGAMYRAFTLKIIRKEIKLNDIEKISELLKNTVIDIRKDRIFLDGEDVTETIREPLVDKHVSLVASIPEVRSKMMELQRVIAKGKSIVAEGRDMGTQVFPFAEIKFYMDASLEERARRRFSDLIKKNKNLTYDEVKADIEERDRRDKERIISPLRKPKDAIVMDTTGKTIEEVVSDMLNIIKKKRGD